MNLEEFIDADPFDPTPAPAPKKRGRPAATKAKPAAKPRFKINHFGDFDELLTLLRDLACLVDPTCRGNVAQQLRVSAELLEMIQTKKA